MKRTFKTADYDATRDVTVRLGDCLPPDPLARLVVDTIAHLDRSARYTRSGARGGQPTAPEILRALLFSGYATGVFRARKRERATYQTLPFRFSASPLPPDHDTRASLRKTFLPALKDLFVQGLLVAQVAGVRTRGNSRRDGTQIHAEASKSKAVSDTHLLALQAHLQAEVEELFALRERVEQGARPAGLVVSDEIAIRQARLARLAEANAVLEARARARTASEPAAYDAKRHQRAAQARQTGRIPRGRAPKPPTPGPRDKDQDTGTDPASRIMKHSRTAGFEQDYTAQIARAQASLLLVGVSLSNHPTDQHHVEPTLDAMAADVGTPKAAALDAGYVSAANIARRASRGIDPYSAPGREPQHPRGQQRFAALPTAPPDAASPTVTMAYKLKTVRGKAIYGVRTCTVEPVIGILKEVLGFREFSLRGERAAAGAWGLVCLAFTLKRLHILRQGYGCPVSPLASK